MDSFWSILVVVAIIVISDQLGGKKKKVPQRPLPRTGGRPGQQKIPMPWPDIKPPAPQEPQEIEVYVEEEPEVPVLRQPMLRAVEKREVPVPEVEAAPREERSSGLGLTPEQAISALAWAEILGKPKAHENGRFRR